MRVAERRTPTYAQGVVVPGGKLATGLDVDLWQRRGVPGSYFAGLQSGVTLDGPFMYPR
jgi:hypothetical protein